MSTEEANKLISDFVGIKPDNLCEYCRCNVYTHWYCKGDANGNRRSHALGPLKVNTDFHSSWDQLMIAYKRVSSLAYSNQIVLDMEASALLDGIEYHILKVEIEHAFRDLAAWIDWYNKSL